MTFHAAKRFALQDLVTMLKSGIYRSAIKESFALLLGHVHTRVHVYPGSLPSGLRHLESIHEEQP